MKIISKPKHLYLGKSDLDYQLDTNKKKWKKCDCGCDEIMFKYPLIKFCIYDFETATGIKFETGELYKITEIKLEKVK